MDFRQFVLLLVVLCSISIGQIDAYPSGVPLSQCGSMMPVAHGVEAQASLAPYVITTEGQYYTTGQRTMSK